MTSTVPTDTGTIDPPGAAWIAAEQAWNLVLYAHSADAVEVLIYSADDSHTPAFCLPLDRRHHRSGPIWHCRVAAADIPGAHAYAWRVRHADERLADLAGNGEKVLHDPYARALFFPPDFDRSAAVDPGPNDGRAPLGLLTEPPKLSRRLDYPLRRNSDLIIYETHVRGFTMQCDDVPPEHRGTFLGVADRIPYLQELGVTAVELMPVQQFDPQERNYWGYMTLNYFAPHQGYATQPDGNLAIREFREMVDRLHAADIEVILDVVYNHTGEGGLRDPIYSFKGIDPEMYYMLDERDALRPYRDFTGCGNTFDPNSIAVQHLILESLRWWHHELHVDGFRFDLAAAFARLPDGTVDTERPTLFGQIGTGIGSTPPRLIGEPWDAAGAYNLGHAFPGTLWRQWNGRFRDCLHRWLAGREGGPAELMSRIYGSADLFRDDHPWCNRPWQSINYACSHDGASLYDLVSYQCKRNHANGENNRDGPQESRWNCGHEGDEDVPEDVLTLRRRQAKNAIALVLLANGTPMIRMGDEFLNTQQGNTNPWNQDNPTTWLDWSRRQRFDDHFRFCRELIRWRREQLPVGRGSFWHEDVTWHGCDGPVDFDRNHLVIQVHGRHLDLRDCLILINGSAEDCDCRLPDGDWQLVLDTASPSPSDIHAIGQEQAWQQKRYPLRGRSVSLLVS